MLLQNVESYAAYVGNAIVNDNIDAGSVMTVVLSRNNIGKKEASGNSIIVVRC